MVLAFPHAVLEVLALCYACVRSSVLHLYVSRSSILASFLRLRLRCFFFRSVLVAIVTHKTITILIEYLSPNSSAVGVLAVLVEGPLPGSSKPGRCRGAEFPLFLQSK